MYVEAPKKSKAPLLLGIFCGLPVLALILFGALAAIVGDDDDSTAARGTDEASCDGPRDTNDTRNLCLYPDRVDRQDQDHEAELGESVRLAGYTASVEAATVDAGLLGGNVLVVQVSVANRDDGAQPYNMFDWRLQTPQGQVLDPWGFDGGDDGIGSGDLVAGGTVTGTVAFEVDTAGDHFVIYKPDPFNSARGIWQVSVEP